MKLGALQNPGPPSPRPIGAERATRPVHPITVIVSVAIQPRRARGVVMPSTYAPTPHLSVGTTLHAGRVASCSHRDLREFGHGLPRAWSETRDPQDRLLVRRTPRSDDCGAFDGASVTSSNFVSPEVLDFEDLRLKIFRSYELPNSAIWG